MKVGVKILLKKEVIDSQGRAVEETLAENGFSVNSCRVGKFIELEIDSQDKSVVEKEASKIAEHILINPMIETFELKFEQ